MKDPFIISAYVKAKWELIHGATQDCTDLTPVVITEKMKK